MFTSVFYGIPRHKKSPFLSLVTIRATNKGAKRSKLPCQIRQKFIWEGATTAQRGSGAVFFLSKSKHASLKNSVNGSLVPVWDGTSLDLSQVSISAFSPSFFVKESVRLFSAEMLFISYCGVLAIWVNIIMRFEAHPIVHKISSLEDLSWRPFGLGLWWVFVGFENKKKKTEFIITTMFCT